MEFLSSEVYNLQLYLAVKYTIKFQEFEFSALEPLEDLTSSHCIS